MKKKEEKEKREEENVLRKLRLSVRPEKISIFGKRAKS